MCATECDPDRGDDQADESIRWPEPSPLEPWWQEVMSGCIRAGCGDESARSPVRVAPAEEAPTEEASPEEAPAEEAPAS
ncbi:hypothetical protein GCM10023094_41480 [Rhodococcus olei]|uniref:Uncharacterized protein n=1 Tax=Rhodococcus olei TaxID=2161675 RepID=A0ABP8PGR2_9NOCA